MKASTTIRLGSEFLLDRRDMLGSGATGEVYKATRVRDSAQVAVKVVELKNVNTEIKRHLLAMEKKAVMSCQSPHVVKGIRIMQNNGCCYIVTELCNGGSLRNLIRENGFLEEGRALKLLVQILKGACDIKEKGIIHRDLKPANILLHNGEAKIIDFGYCQIEGQQKLSQEYNVGSPSFMSPEAFLQNQYSQKSDIWAIGVTFYQCLNGKTFDEGREMSEVYTEMKQKGLSYSVQVSDRCKNILKWCFQQDPKKRPTALELLHFIQSQQKGVKQPSSDQEIHKSLKEIKNNDFGPKEKAQSQPSQNEAKIIQKSNESEKVNLETKEISENADATQNKTQKKTKGLIRKQKMLRYKSQFFQENQVEGSLGIRAKSKQNLFGISSNSKKIPQTNESKKNSLSDNNSDQTIFKNQ